MSLLVYYVILCVICISKKLKYLKNKARVTYSVILSVLSNKTNLILGFSFPLTSRHQHLCS